MRLPGAVNQSKLERTERKAVYFSRALALLQQRGSAGVRGIRENILGIFIERARRPLFVSLPLCCPPRTIVFFFFFLSVSVANHWQGQERGQEPHHQVLPFEDGGGGDGERHRRRGELLNTLQEAQGRGRRGRDAQKPGGIRRFRFVLSSQPSESESSYRRPACSSGVNLNCYLIQLKCMLLLLLLLL